MSGASVMILGEDNTGSVGTILFYHALFALDFHHAAHLGTGPLGGTAVHHSQFKLAFAISQGNQLTGGTLTISFQDALDLVTSNA